MIKREEFDVLIGALNLGTSTAEKDPLLETAQIETPEFKDIFHYDRFDIVRGVKGAGKTALYRLFEILDAYMRENKQIVSIFGVEASGDPVFLRFRKQFSEFSEIDFQNFWILYFMALIRERIEDDPMLANIRQDPDFQNVDADLKRIDIAITGGKSLLEKASEAIESTFRARNFEPGITTSYKVDGTVSHKLSLGIEREKTEDRAPIYVGDIKKKLCSLLKKNNIRIWIMLDRLDEVFQRLSKEEESGLKGLLRAAYNISEPEVRVKLFLRDDIIHQLASSEGGFAALTHVTDRGSSTLRWFPANILLLIVKRLFSSKILANHFEVDISKLNDDPNYRERVFYQIFPPHIGKVPTFEWIISALRDGNDLITPRDVIDLFNHAKAIEARRFQLEPSDKMFLLDEESFKGALKEVSRDKKSKVLIAEYPQLKVSILKLENGKSNHNEKSLSQLFGGEWNKIAADLKTIGLFRFDPKKVIYRIPRLWWTGLGIRLGSAFVSDGKEE